MARLYQTCAKEPTSAESTGSVGQSGQPTAPRMTNHKSPGKTFKHSGRNTMSASQMTTLVGNSGVRKQQFVKM